jgi:prefoldin subunit 5
MKDRIEARLAELRAEFESGQRLLAELDEKREKLRESMLRIAGAIQVLEEMAGEGEEEEKEEGHVHTDVQP